MQTTASPSSALLRRWQRLQLHVRCALRPDEPALIRQYLGCGTLLTRRADLPAAATQLRMLGVLLQAANDEALPWFWRSVCLEHVTQPLARLSALLRLHDPLAWQAIEAAVQRAQERLPAAPSAA